MPMGRPATRHEARPVPRPSVTWSLRQGPASSPCRGRRRGSRSRVDPTGPSRRPPSRTVPSWWPTAAPETAPRGLAGASEDEESQNSGPVAADSKGKRREQWSGFRSELEKVGKQFHGARPLATWPRGATSKFGCRTLGSQAPNLIRRREPVPFRGVRFAGDFKRENASCYFQYLLSELLRRREFIPSELVNTAWLRLNCFLH